MDTEVQFTTEELLQFDKLCNIIESSPQLSKESQNKIDAYRTVIAIKGMQNLNHYLQSSLDELKEKREQSIE